MRVLLFLLIALQLACSTTPEKAPFQIEVTGGEIVGFSESGVDRWYGIPFAAPPVGELRWKTPQPVIGWDTVRPTKAFGPAAMQHNVWGDMQYRSDGFSEDCLYLNVWAPEGPRENMPVLLYYYGGGLIAGDGSETRYDGASMAREGIVVVTTNYRLNVFGFLAHPELTAESPNAASGNYGHHDQVKALEWVKENIAAFGGDPNHITIGGESAGSISVATLLTSPMSRDLLAGAIGESGAPIYPLYASVPQKEADESGAAFAKTIGSESLAELRAISADSLYARFLRSEIGRFKTVLDGKIFSSAPEEIYEEKKVPSIPLLVGWNSQEMPAGLLLGEDMSVQNFTSKVREKFPSIADELLSIMPHAKEEEVQASATLLASDSWISYPSWRWSDLHAKNTNAEVFRYWYDHARPGQTGGAPHAAEIPYALGNLDLHKTYEWEEADRKTSKTMKAYFANFIKTGNPNGEGLGEWSPLARTNTVEQPVMVIKPESKQVTMDDRRYPLLKKHYDSERLK